jgi:hypothetical protein
MLKELIQIYLKKAYDLKWFYVRLEYQNRGTIHAHIISNLTSSILVLMRENAHHFENFKNQNSYPNLYLIKKIIVLTCREGP